MLIDIHAHFYTERSGRSDWQSYNARRLEVGDHMGIDMHVASILGSWGSRSPTYFPSPDDVTHANTRMTELATAYPRKVRGYCVVNPNYPEHARAELDRGLGAGLIGIKLAASRRANDSLLDPIAALAGQRGVPILHHIWQHRRREWPGQEASDGVELAELAARHPDARFILAHIGGGGDWAHTLRAVRPHANIWIDLSGSGVDAGMIEATLETVGSARMLWGCDVTLDTGLAKLRYLEHLGISGADRDAITHRNARSLFPDGAFP